MQTPNPINVAIIGLGWVATQRHLPVILNNPHLHLYGFVDRRPQKLQNINKKYPLLQTSLSSEGEMPWGKEVQAVLITTDPLNHFQLAKNSLLAGKHVLMEKPLTMTPAEANELLELKERLNVSLCVVHNFQFARSTLRLKENIRMGKLGEILSIEATQLSNSRRRLPEWYERLPFGLFYDESPHMLYMLEALAGEPIRHLTSSVIRRAGRNTPLSVIANYAAGHIPIQLSMNFEASLSEWHIAVYGTRGIGIVDLFRDILVTLPNDGAHRAREILTSSASSITTHLWGFLTSGLLQARGKLFYGADIVWERFVEEIEGIRPADEISALRGLRIVNLQYEIMTQSETFEIASK